ncbi:MAG: hypothetical protein ACRECC_14780 [Pseudolabrys sp.]|jgi:hypothetical protein
MLKAAAIAFLATMLASSGAHAGKIGSPFVVDLGFLGDDGCDSDSVASLQNYGFVVVYVCDIDFSDSIKGRIFDLNGNNPVSILNLDIDPWSGDPPSVGSSASGRFVVAWDQFGKDVGYDVIAKRFRPNGVRFAREARVNTTRPGDQVQPSVAMLNDSGYVVVWRSHPAKGPDGIFGRLYDVNGKPLGNDFQVNTQPALYADAPSVAALSTGGFVVAWNSGAQLYNAKGKRVAGEFKFNTQVANHQIKPRVTALENGAFEIVWVLPGQGIYGQRYNRLGRAVGNEIQVVAGSDLDFPAIAGLIDGRFVVTWTNAAVNAGAGGVFGQIYNVRGNPAGSAFEVDTPDFQLSATYPSHIAGLSTGGFVVTWSDNSTANGSNNGEVRAQLFGP